MLQQFTDVAVCALHRGKTAGVPLSRRLATALATADARWPMAQYTQHVLVALIKNGNERVPEQRGSQACSGPSGERQQQPMAQLPAD